MNHYALTAQHNGDYTEPRRSMQIKHNGSTVWTKDIPDIRRSLIHGVLEAHAWMEENVQTPGTVVEAVARRLDVSEIERLLPKDTSDADPRLIEIRQEIAEIMQPCQRNGQPIKQKK